MDDSLGIWPRKGGVVCASLGGIANPGAGGRCAAPKLHRDCLLSRRSLLRRARSKQLKHRRHRAHQRERDQGLMRAAP